MPIRDILLFMVSHPQRTPLWAMEQTYALADRFEARVSTVLCQKTLPRIGNWLADRLVHANELIASENAKSRDAAQSLLAEFVAMGDEASRGEQLLLDSGPVILPDKLAARARLHDLTVVPVAPELEYQVAAEGLIFGSARPILLLPHPVTPVAALKRIVIGWDGDRPATRALAAAMPFCRLADTVQFAVITGDKELNDGALSDDLLRHMRFHDVRAEIVEIPAKGRDAGVALTSHALAGSADVLVMGAYGHSRTREFLLGGATRSVLGNPQLPVMLVH